MSVAVVGDDAAANRAVADVIGKSLSYAVLHTPDIIKKATGMSVASIVKEEGAPALAAVELQVASELSTQLRSVVSFAGDGVGVAARGSAWRYMFGMFSIWLDTDPGASEAEAPQRGAYDNAEIRIDLPAAAAMAGDDATPSQVAQAAAAQAMRGLKELLRRQSELPRNKALYIKLGCRGDWPEIQHPDWRNPEDEAAAAESA
ncbi:unnamed protein product [Pedinophyceae sp. YPF-701]|nr:unnamed protein product [Pedinophyceae sp. YPF-701]